MLVRRSFVAVAFVPMLAVALYAVFSRGTPWRGEWAWTIDWATGSTLLLAPLVAGTAAFDRAAWHDLSSKLLDSTPRAALARLAQPFPAFLGGGLAYLCALGVAMGVSVSAGARPSWDARLVLMALASLGAAAAVGALVAEIWPTSLSAPVAAILVLGLGIGASATGLPAVFRVGGVTGTLVGLTLSPRFFWLIGGCTILLMGSCLAWLCARAKSYRILAMVLSAATVACVLLAWASPPERLVVSSRPVSFTCAARSPEVCLASDTSRLLDELPGQLADAAKPLSSAGIPIPSTFTQVVPGSRVRSGAPLYLESSDINGTRLPTASVDSALAVPAVCDADTGETMPPEPVFEARSTITAWLALQSGRITAADLADRTDEAWLRRPHSEQITWLRDTYALLSQCEYGSVTPAL